MYDRQQQLVWIWEQQDPFGGNPPDENPSGLGAFEFPLRFPGQFADRETGLFYNMARDYDPGTSRYIQSDPIGLAGGFNTYLYAAGMPILLVDAEGLKVTGEWINGTPTISSPQLSYTGSQFISLTASIKSCS